MEQKISVDISTEKLEDTNNSPPQKRAKCQPKENLPPLEATSINAAETNDSLMGTNHLLNQQHSAPGVMWLRYSHHQTLVD